MIALFKNIHLDILMPHYILAAFILAVVLFTLVIYRRTNPIVSNLFRRLLIMLRMTTLLLMLLVLLAATLQLFLEKENRPILAVAIDNSASMAVIDKSGSRAEIVNHVLQSELFKSLDKKMDLKFYSFANAIQPLMLNQDSIQYIGDVTNIEKALESIKADNALQNLCGILIISDGVYNAGGNPVRTAGALGVPVHAVAVGSTEPPMDLAITRVEANTFCYVDKATPIRLTVHNAGFSSLTLPVSLKNDSGTILTETMIIPGSPSDQEIEISFTPRKIGRQKLTLSIPGQSGEQTRDNNQRTIYIDVLKSRLNIALIAGRLSVDISFLSRLLSTDRHTVDTFISNNSGGFYFGKSARDIDNADMLIFYDFPAQNTPRALIEQIIHLLEKKKLPLLVIPGKKTDTSELNRFRDFTPVASFVRLPREQSIYAHLSPIGETHPVMQVAEDAMMTQSLWSELPPVFSLYAAHQLAEDATVLAYSRANASSKSLAPLVLLRQNGSQKSAAILAYELWRWDLMMWGVNRTEDVYRTFLINLVRWLETNRSENLVQAEMDGPALKFGDAANISISVFDENLNPVDDAEVSIELRSKRGQMEIPAPSTGEGKYAVSIQLPQPDDYEAIVSAAKGGRHLGQDTLIFSVGQYSAELADLQAQPAVLRSLARTTGGAFSAADSAEALADQINGVATHTPVTIERELWNAKIILALILLFLTLEWYLRKRKGML